MKIAIDISVPAGNLLLQTLASISTSELIPFYSKKISLLKIFRETGADVFLLNGMCNYNDAQFLKANYGITIIHLGDDHQNVVADLVTGNSERFDSLGFDKLIDLKGSTKGQYRKSTLQIMCALLTALKD